MEGTMPETKKVLLVGESWVSSATHYKGFDNFGSTTFHSGAGPLIAALDGSGFEIEHMAAHEAPEGLPLEIAGYDRWDAILLSDIGANSILLHPEVWLTSRTVPNRLILLRDWVAAGGGLAMIGGYLTFQGIDGRARWRNTPVETTLPVRCHPWDDRIESPEGIGYDFADPGHALLDGVPGDWPPLLGLNEVTMAAGHDAIVSAVTAQGTHPLLAAGRHGAGRTVAWMSDIGPHWAPPAFCDWPGYARLWSNILGYLCDRAA
ncbi:cytoplasmic protein [Rhodobacterales bacterium HKCCE2091]|nr:cytoplasmic protein [Rhodobacterales bacterium HKCCE2091]